MFRRGKIDWKRLCYAAKETMLDMLCGVIVIIVAGVSIFLCLVTNYFLVFVFCILLIFFVVKTWENYNGIKYIKNIWFHLRKIQTHP